MAEENGRYQLLEDVLEPEMVKQYRIRRGAHCVYMPRFGQEKYLCPCGTINPLDKPCYVCGLDPEPLSREVMEQLGRDAQERLAEEERQQKELEKRRLERERLLRKKRRIRLMKNIAALIGGVVAVAALGFALFWVSTREWIPAGHYRAALQALNRQEWELAHREFTLSNGHRDAKEYLARFSTPVLTADTRTADSALCESYTYDADGNRLVMNNSSYAMYEDGTEVLLEAGTWTNIYEKADRPLQLEDTGGKRLFTYNAQGNKITEEEYRADGVQESYQYWNYEYDAQGRVTRMMEICSELLSVNYSYEYEEQYTYGTNGEVLTKATYANYPASPEGNYKALFTYTYDAQGRVVEAVEEVTQTQDQNGDSVKQEQWCYDGEKLVQYTRRVEHLTDARLNSVQTVTHTYDSAGRLLKTEDINEFPNDPMRNFTETYEAVYDREGRIQREEERTVPVDESRFALSAFTKRGEYTYDLMGRCTEIKRLYDYPLSSSMESYATREVFTYRSDGTPQSSVTYKNTPAEPSWKVSFSQQFNENGLTASKISDPNGRKVESTYTYAYFYK